MKKFNNTLSILFLSFVFSFIFFAESHALDVIYSNNLMGRLEHCGCPGSKIGGMARRKTKIDELKSGIGDERKIIIVDGGNSLYDGKNVDKLNRCTFTLKTDYFVKALMEAGIDVMNIGNDDVKLEEGFLISLMTAYKLPLTSANLSFKNSDILQPYKIVKKGKIEIGVIGLTNLSKVPKNFRYLSPNAALAKYYQYIQNTQYKILLADLPEDQIDSITREYNFDFIIDGNNKKEKYIESRTIGESVVLATRNESKVLGFFDYNGKNNLFALTDEVADHNSITQIVNKYKSENKECQSDGTYSAANQTYVSSLSCLPCHKQIYYKWNSTLHSTAYNELLQDKNENNPSCVRCHTTGYRVEGGFGNSYLIGEFKGVQCEECHGPGLWHVWQGGDKRFIKKEVPKQVCKKCHQEERSPNFKYEEYLHTVSCSISHWVKEEFVFDEEKNTLHVGFKLNNSSQIAYSDIELEILSNKTDILFEKSTFNISEMISEPITHSKIPAISIPFSKKEKKNSKEELYKSKEGIHEKIKAKLRYSYEGDGEAKQQMTYLFQISQPRSVEKLPEISLQLAESGKLWIKSSPTTSIFLNGKRQQYNTPRMVTLNAGLYRVELRNEEQNVYYQQEIRIGGDQPKLQKLDLNFTVDMVIKSSPYPLDVRIDKSNPWRQTLTKIKKLRAGLNTLFIKNEEQGILSELLLDILPHRSKVVIEIFVNKEDNTVIVKERRQGGDIVEHLAISGESIILNEK